MVAWFSKAGHNRGSCCSSRKTSLCAWSLPKSTLDRHNTTGKLFYGLFKLMLNCLGRTRSTTLGKKGDCMKTSPQQWTTVEGASCFGAALLSLDSWPLATEKWIPRFIKVSNKIMSGWLSASWSSVEAEWHSRTKNLNMEVNLWQNDFQFKKIHLPEWPRQNPDIYPKQMLWTELSEKQKMSELKHHKH